MAVAVPKDQLQALYEIFSSSSNTFSDMSEDEIMKLVHNEIKKSRQDEETRGKTK